MRLLDRYLASELVKGMLPVLLLLGGLLSFLALADQLEDVGKGSFSTLAAVQVVVLTLPRTVLGILPVVLLLAALIGLGGLANHRELTAIRAAGVSPARIALPLLAVAVALIGLVYVAQSHLIPDWERQALRLRAATVGETDVDRDDFEYWTRTGDRLLRVGEVLYGRVPTDIEIYQLDADHRLTGLIQARRADLIEDNVWLLHDVLRRDLAPETVEENRLAQLTWRNTLTPGQLASLIQPAQTLSPADILAYIANLESNGLDSHQYRLVFWQMLSLPLAMLAMVVLAVPFVLGSLRAVPIGQRVALGGGIGLVFYLGEQVIGHVAMLYELDPALAAMTPDLALLALAIWAMRRRS